MKENLESLKANCSSYYQFVMKLNESFRKAKDRVKKKETTIQMGF